MLLNYKIFNLTKHLPMKTFNKPATSKLATRFDNELKTLLMEDLKVLRERNQFVNSNKRAPVRQLSAA